MRRRLRGITTKVTAPAPAPAPAPTPGEVPTAPVPEPELDETGPVTTAAEKPAVPVDEVLAAAVEISRAAAVEAGGSRVGDHLGTETEDELVVTHSFATTDPAYVGWRWAVTVTRLDGSDQVTVDEVVLLPGSGALLAPAWVPWSERVQPGDLSPGDLLPTAPDDPRLVPSYAEPEAELAADAFWELGLGRPRVMSWDGRADAAERWYDGDHGPDTPIARQAPRNCVDCGFRLSMAGGLRSLFGVCANALAPDDGKVVSMDHGCGAHSEIVVETPRTSSMTAGMVVEDDELELVSTGPSPDDETPDGHAS